MDFSALALHRQSCRSFDNNKKPSKEVIDSILSTATTAPSACNGQPYKIFVSFDSKAQEIAKATQGMGMNKFALDAPVQIVIAEDKYNKTAAMGAKIKNNDYRSIDIGILAAYITAAAADSGLDSCILGWFDAKRISEICETDKVIRLVISLGYATEGYPLRAKKRKKSDDIISYL